MLQAEVVRVKLLMTLQSQTPLSHKYLSLTVLARGSRTTQHPATSTQDPNPSLLDHAQAGRLWILSNGRIVESVAKGISP